MTNSIDERDFNEHLIQFVKERKVLWDFKCSGYFISQHVRNDYYREFGSFYGFDGNV